MIRVDAVWLCTEPIDMRAGTDTALARVVQVFGAARPHHAYIFANRRSTRAVVYDFTETRAGEHARAFLGAWRGSLVCDDYTGYKASFVLGVTEADCMAQYLENSFIGSRRGLRQRARGELQGLAPDKI